MAALRHDAYAVFAQHGLELGAFRSQAQRFFGAKVGFAADPAMVMLAHPKANGTRRCTERAATDADYAAADAAERLQNTSGMALLARRCRSVWLVEREAEDDRVALFVAAILASTLLGPILDPSGTALFGVRTARIRLELL